MKSLIALLLTVGTLQCASAQECTHKGPKGQKQCEGMSADRKKGGHGRKGKKGMMSQLNLSADQKEKMKSLREEGKKKMDDLNSNTSITVKEFNDRKTAIKKEMNQKRDAILTNDQKDQLAKAKTSQQQKREENFNKKLDRQKTKLGLSDDQVQKMKSLHDKTKSDVETIKNDNKLNDQEKKMKIKAIMKKAKENRNNIYTKEQRNKIEEHKSKGKKNHDKK